MIYNLYRVKNKLVKFNLVNIEIGIRKTIMEINYLWKGEIDAEHKSILFCTRFMNNVFFLNIILNSSKFLNRNAK